MLEQYENIQDIVDEINSKNNIFLIGTSEYGETNVPKLIPDLAYLYAEFGRRGSLIEAIENIFDESILTKNIYAVKTTGCHSKAILNVNIVGKDVVDSGVIFRSKHSNEKYDDVKITLNNDSITFNIDDKLITYLYEDYKTINNLADKINKDTNKNKNYVYMETYVDDSVKLVGALDTVNDNTIYLHTGNSGLNVSKNDLYISLKNTLDLIEGYCIDVLIPLDAYIDDISLEEDAINPNKLNLKINNNKATFYDLISNFINTQFATGNTTIAVMGFNPYNKLSIDEKIEMLKKNKVLSKNQISNSFIVVSSNCLYNSKVSRVSNGQVELGCLINTNDLKESVTFKDFPKFYSSIEDFTNDELLKISNNNMTAFRYSHYKKRAVVATSSTSSDSENKGFSVLQNIIVLQFITKLLYKISESYIGEDINKVIKNNSLKNEYEKCLTEIRALQYINDFDIVIEKVSACEIKITTTLQSIFTLEFLELINELRVSGNEV